MEQKPAAPLPDEQDHAQAYCHQELEVCAKIGFPQEVYLTRVRLAGLLPEIFPGVRGRAVVHLDFAIGQLHHMKTHQCLWRVLRHL